MKSICHVYYSLKWFLYIFLTTKFDANVLFVDNILCEFILILSSHIDVREKKLKRYILSSFWKRAFFLFKKNV